MRTMDSNRIKSTFNDLCWRVVERPAVDKLIGADAGLAEESRPGLMGRQVIKVIQIAVLDVDLATCSNHGHITNL